MKQIKDYTPNQGYFISFHPETFFNKSSLEWTVHKIIEDNIDINQFLNKMKNQKKGQKEYSPKLLLKIIFYSYCKGVFSSHKMEELMKKNLSYIFLSDNNIIDHSTICRFIIKYSDEIKNVFSRVLYVCWKLDLVNLDMIAVDGTKIKANASRYFTGNKKQFEDLKERLKKRIEKLLKRQERIDKKKSRKYFETDSKRKIDRQIKHFNIVIKKIDAFFKKVKNEKEKINLTDTDCKIQKGENGKFFNGYNAQAVATDDIIIATDITNNQSDRNELLKMMEKSDNNLKNLGIKDE